MKEERGGCGYVFVIVLAVAWVLLIQEAVMRAETRLRRIEQALGIELTVQQRRPFGAEIPMPPSKLPKP